MLGIFIQLLLNSTNIANTACDLEVFSKHGGRKAINTDDVMLLTRRNDALETMLKQELDSIRGVEGRNVDGPVVIGKGKAKGKDR